MVIYTMPEAENAVNIKYISRAEINSSLEMISSYIINTPTEYFLGIDEDNMYQIKTNSIEDSLKVYNILFTKFPKIDLYLIHKGKVMDPSIKDQIINENQGIKKLIYLMNISKIFNNLLKILSKTYKIFFN